MDIRLTALLGDQRLGPFLVRPSGELAIGRNAAEGLVLDQHWVPRTLCTLAPTERGWLVVNGPSTRLRVSNKWVKADFATRSSIALPEGDTVLSWPSLADPMRVKLRVGHGVAEGLRSPSQEMPQGHVAGADLVAERMAGTVWPGGGLEPTQKRTMAVLFRHLLDGSPKPRNLYQAAASELGVSEDAVKKQLRRVRDRLNRDRFQKLRSADEVGEYLVEVAGLVGVGHLPTATRHLEGRLRAARRVRRRGDRPPGDGS